MCKVKPDNVRMKAGPIWPRRNMTTNNDEDEGPNVVVDVDDDDDDDDDHDN